MRPLGAMRRRTGQHYFSPVVAVVVRQQDAGLGVAFRRMLDRLNPAAAMLQSKWQPGDESHVAIDQRIRQLPFGPLVRAKDEKPRSPGSHSARSATLRCGPDAACRGWSENRPTTDCEPSIQRLRPAPAFPASSGRSRGWRCRWAEARLFVRHRVGIHSAGSRRRASPSGRGKRCRAGRPRPAGR